MKRARVHGTVPLATLALLVSFVLAGASIAFGVPPPAAPPLVASALVSPIPAAPPLAALAAPPLAALAVPPLAAPATAAPTQAPSAVGIPAHPNDLRYPELKFEVPKADKYRFKL